MEKDGSYHARYVSDEWDSAPTYGRRNEVRWRIIACPSLSGTDAVNKKKPVERYV